jgi:hypothetical protein
MTFSRSPENTDRDHVSIENKPVIAITPTEREKLHPFTGNSSKLIYKLILEDEAKPYEKPRDDGIRENDRLVE